jgi:hypothetical protein
MNAPFCAPLVGNLRRKAAKTLPQWLPQRGEYE